LLKCISFDKIQLRMYIFKMEEFPQFSGEV